MIKSEGSEDGREAPSRRDRRFDLVLVLAFLVMVAAGAAVFPLSVAANKLSGLWITLCASMGIGDR